jgi:hypothetical protein
VGTERRIKYAVILFILGLFGTLGSVYAQEILYGSGTQVGDGSSNIYRIENHAATPTAVNIGEAGVWLLDIAIDPTDGQAYGVSTFAFYAVDLETGVATFISFTAPNQNALEFSPDGKLYSWGFSDTNLYEINKMTGFATPVFNTGLRSDGDLAYHPIEGVLYGNATEDTLVRINPVAKTVSVIGPFSTSDLFGLEIDETGQMFAAKGQEGGRLASLYRIDITNGNATLIGDIAHANNTYGVTGLAFGTVQDTDGDGVSDSGDNCLNDFNPGQEDGDEDGVGDVCDNCPDDFNDDQLDSDLDGIGNACDSFPDNPDNDLAQCRLDLGEIETMLQQCDNNLTQCDFDFDRCSSDLNSKIVDVAQCQTNLTTTQTDFGQCKTDLARLQTTLGQCQSNLGTAQIELRQAQAELARALAAIDAMRACLTSYKKENGKRCRDRKDNDCDGLTDRADPDCR